MSKLTILLITFSFFSIQSATANEIRGHRIGAGFNKVTDVTDTQSSYSRGTGIKLEYGYEFNKVIGLNGAFTTHSDSAYDIDISGISNKVDADIGYTFISDSFTVKPYGAIGIISMYEDYAVGDFNISAMESSILLGIGARAVINKHLYADIRYDIMAFEEIDVDTFSFTVGYKF